MNPIGDAAEVENLARSYRREAQNIESAADQAMRHLQKVVHQGWWEGNRASQTLNALENDRRLVARQAQELRAMANALERHAEWIRQTIAELEGLEYRIRNWAIQNPPNPESPIPDSSLITYWPAYCSYDWRTLSRRLRSHGVFV